tara:strand:- start:24 stop:536 length:513 start_codon:yes stop_codon:yes gene_type:complete
MAAEAGMPQLDPTYWASQAFWLIIIFSSIYFVISKIFIPKIKNNIDAREDKIRKNLEEAKQLREDAEKKLKVYDDLMKKSKLDAKKVIYESRQKINQDLQNKKKQVEIEIEKEIDNAQKEINEFKKESIKKINLISEEIASDLIKDIFAEDLNKSSIEASVSETLKEFKN